MSFNGDELIYGGVKAEQKNSINYRECRYFKTDFDACCRYYFVTICYGDYVEEILQELSLEPTDIIVMNSCLWDVHRHGKKGIDNYEENLEKLVLALRRLMPDCIFVWLTTPPVAIQSKGGFLVNPGNESVKIQEVKLCNSIAREVFTAANNLYGTFKVVDLDYVFQFFEHHRASDGVHWNERAHRRMSNMILEELSKVYNMKVPRVLDDHKGRSEREFLSAQSRNPWADDDRNDFWSNERNPVQNGWDFDDSQRGLPRIRLPGQGYPFIPRNIPRPTIKFGPLGVPVPSFDLRVMRLPLNDLDDLGHARHQVESQVESRKRKRGSTGESSEKPPEKQYRFGVPNISSNAALLKRKAEEAVNEPAKRMKIEEVDGKLKKLFDIGEGVTIHLPLNAKEKDSYFKELAENAKKEKAKEEKMAEEEKKAEEKKVEEKRILEEKKVEDELKKKRLEEENLLAEHKKAVVKQETVATAVAAKKEVFAPGKKDTESRLKVVATRPTKVFMTRQRKNMGKAKVEIKNEKEIVVEGKEDHVHDGKCSQQKYSAINPVTTGNEEEAMNPFKGGLKDNLGESSETAKDTSIEQKNVELDGGILKVTPLEEAMKNVSELPLVSSVPENADEIEEEKPTRKILVPTRRSSRLSKSASKLLNLIKTPVQELLDKVPCNSQKLPAETSTTIKSGSAVTKQVSSEKKLKSNATKSTSASVPKVIATEDSITHPTSTTTKLISSQQSNQISTLPIAIDTKIPETTIVTMSNEVHIVKTNISSTIISNSISSTLSSTTVITPNNVSKEKSADKFQMPFVTISEPQNSKKTVTAIPTPKVIVPFPKVMASAGGVVSTTARDATSTFEEAKPASREMTPATQVTQELAPILPTVKNSDVIHCNKNVVKEEFRKGITFSTVTSMSSQFIRVSLLPAPVYEGTPTTTTNNRSYPVATTVNNRAYPVSTTTTNNRSYPVATTASNNRSYLVATTATNNRSYPVVTTTSNIRSCLVATTATNNRSYPVATTATNNRSYPVATTATNNRSYPVVTTTSNIRSYPVATTTSNNRSYPDKIAVSLDKTKLSDIRSIIKTASVEKTVVCTVNSIVGVKAVLDEKIATTGKVSMGHLNSRIVNMSEATSVTKIPLLPATSTKMSTSTNMSTSVIIGNISPVCVSSVVTKPFAITSAVKTVNSSQTILSTKALPTTISPEVSVNSVSVCNSHSLINVSPKKVDTLALLSMPSPFAKPKPKQVVPPKVPAIFDQKAPLQASSLNLVPTTLVATNNIPNAQSQVYASTTKDTSIQSTQTAPIAKGGSYPCTKISPLVCKGSVSSEAVNGEMNKANKVGERENKIESENVASSIKTPPVSSGNVISNAAKGIDHLLPTSDINKELKIVSTTSIATLEHRSPQVVTSNSMVPHSSLTNSRQAFTFTGDQKNFNMDPKGKHNISSLPINNNAGGQTRGKSVSDDFNEDLLLAEADATEDLSDLDESILEDASGLPIVTSIQSKAKWVGSVQSNSCKMATSTVNQRYPSHNSRYPVLHSQNSFVHRHPNPAQATGYPAGTSVLAAGPTMQKLRMENTPVQDLKVPNQVAPGTVLPETSIPPVKEKKKVKKYPNETKEEKRARRQLKREKKEKRLKEKEEKKKLLANAVTQESIVSGNSNSNWDSQLQQNPRLTNSRGRVRSATWAPPYYPAYDKDSKRNLDLQKRLTAPEYPHHQSYQQNYRNEAAAKHQPCDSQTYNRLPRQQHFNHQRMPNPSPQRMQRPAIHVTQNPTPPRMPTHTPPRMPTHTPPRMPTHTPPRMPTHTPPRMPTHTTPRMSTHTPPRMPTHTPPRLHNPALHGTQNVSHGMAIQHTSPRRMPNAQQMFANPPLVTMQNLPAQIVSSKLNPTPVQQKTEGFNLTPQQQTLQQNTVHPEQSQQTNVVHPGQPQHKNAILPGQSSLQAVQPQPSVVHPGQSRRSTTGQPQQNPAQSMHPEPVASLSYHQPSCTDSRSIEKSNQPRQQPPSGHGLLPTQKPPVPTSVKRIQTLNPNQTLAKPNQQHPPSPQPIQTILKAPAVQNHVPQSSKTGQMINQAAVAAQMLNPYQHSLHSQAYQQSQQHLVHQQHSAVIAHQQLNSQQLMQQQQLLQQQNSAAHNAGHRQLYIDEYGQTYTLEEETYIVGPSGQIQNISSATNAYMQQQQLQQQGAQLQQQQQQQQQYAIQSPLVYSNQQQSGYL